MAVRFFVTVTGLESAKHSLTVTDMVANDPLMAIKSKKDLEDLVGVFQHEDRSQFIRRSKGKGGWRQISIMEMLWGRKRTPTGAPFRRLSQVYGSVGGSIPLMDTGKLFQGVSGIRGYFIRVYKRGPHMTEITWGPKAPYAVKHTRPEGEDFSFGPIEKARLKRRVPPPSGKLNRVFKGKWSKQPRRGLEVARREYRPYYIFLKTAEKHYGARWGGSKFGGRWSGLSGTVHKKLPQRTWIRPYPATKVDLARLKLEGHIEEFIRQRDLAALRSREATEKIKDRITRAREIRGRVKDREMMRAREIEAERIRQLEELD